MKKINQITITIFSTPNPTVPTYPENTTTGSAISKRMASGVMTYLDVQSEMPSPLSIAAQNSVTLRCTQNGVRLGPSKRKPCDAT